MKVALVHDFLTEYGGAERVLETLHEIWPNAPVFTAYYEPGSLGPHSDRFKSWDIRVSWAKNLPFFKKLLSPYRILGPLIFESFDFKNFDLVISSTNVYFAKSIITGPNTIHVCYCHTPPRYLYGYPTAREWKKYLIPRILGEAANHFLRIWDFWSAQRVDYFIANSQNTRRRIQKFYRRETEVIYPPIDVAKFKPSGKLKKDGYFLCVSRLARAKRIDLVIEAANKLRFQLKVVGTGRDENYLHSIARENVEFLGEVKDDELVKLYQKARAVIFPAEEEDFGMVPVEAQASGTPVIALRQGGIFESVIEGKTGIFFDEPTVESLIHAIKEFDKSNYRSEDLINWAKKFNKGRFKKEILDFVSSLRA